MRLSWLLACLSCFVFAAYADAQLKERSEDPPPPADATEGLVDEDEDILPQTEYAFNPIQAKKDLKVGDFYWKKGNHRAAAARYLEATRWNPTYSEAFWKLARAREKLDQTAEALDAYRSFVEVEGDGKKVDEARGRIAEIEKEFDSPPLSESAHGKE